MRKAVDEILALAQSLDDQATAEIRGALPSPIPGAGFGASSPVDQYLTMLKWFPSGT